MAFYIPPNTFLGVAKLHVFRIKILGTLGDALQWKWGISLIRKKISIQILFSFPLELELSYSLRKHI